MDDITRALAAGQGAEAERLAHTAKGLAGNIGADRIRHLAEAVEQAIHEQAGEAAITQALAELAPPLAELVDHLTHDLPPLPAPPASPPTAAAPDAALAPICRRLAALLANDDAAAGNLLEEAGPTLQAAFPEAYPVLAEGVRAYDFEAALATLREAAGRLDIGL